MIVSGDFNSTWDHARYRDLFGSRYADAAAQAGVGIVPTWPTDRAFPPFLALDHVLLADAVATAVETVQLPGSDHRGLFVRVATGARSATG